MENKSRKQSSTREGQKVAALDSREGIREFFNRAIAIETERKRKPLTAPRRPNRRTYIPPESQHAKLWRLFNLAVHLMDVPEARQDAKWWADRDVVLMGWDELLRKRDDAVKGS